MAAVSPSSGALRRRRGASTSAPCRLGRTGRRALVATCKSTGKFFVGGNWKCNGDTSGISSIVHTLNGVTWDTNAVEVVCSPPLLYMPQVQQSLKADYQLSAQNCWGAGNGAYTGEVSADMLVDSKVPWVILGHSERRALCGETNEVVAGKVRYAIEKGMQVMVCVGETLEQREAGTTMPTIVAQLAAVAAAVDEPMWASIVIAYEPVWAIGTGKVATPEQAQAVHLDIRAWVGAEVGEGVAAAVRIIYGGSVNGGNCRSLAQEADIDGFLVGGASLKPEFGDIINANSAVTV